MDRRYISSITRLGIGATMLFGGSFLFYNDMLDMPPQGFDRYQQLIQERNTPVFQSELYKNRGSIEELGRLDAIDFEFKELMSPEFKQEIRRYENGKFLIAPTAILLAGGITFFIGGMVGTLRTRRKNKSTELKEATI